MLPFLSPPLFALCLLCLILLLCGKASKKREDMPSVHEGITARLFLLLFYPPTIPNVWLSACSIVCLCIFCLSVCQVTCLYKNTTALSSVSAASSPVILHIWGRQYQSNLCRFPFLNVPITCTSFFFSSSLFPTPHFHYPYHSYWLFTRSVNNCLPTVVIASPCQPEVWSKWQCAQLSLAYMLKSPVSPWQEKGAGGRGGGRYFSVQLFFFEGYISETTNLFAFQSDSFYFSSAVGKFIFSGRLCWTVRARCKHRGEDASHKIKQMITFCVAQRQGCFYLTSHFTQRQMLSIHLQPPRFI